MSSRPTAADLAQPSVQVDRTKRSAGTAPPNKRISCRLGSEVISASVRAPGPGPVSCLQVPPKRHHVSPKWVTPFHPRATTILPPSVAMPLFIRGPGEVDGDSCVHVEPSNDHVSPR